jgi:hypothetical protein
VARGQTFDLASNPDVLFQVVGDVSSPRMIPVAEIRNGELRRIGLTAKGWMEFDAVFLRRGKSYSLYRDGRADGGVEVTRGMWEREGEPLYSLQGCKVLTPLAAVRVASAYRPTTFTIEYLASTARLGAPRTAASLPRATVERIAREAAARVAADSGIDSKQLASLTLRATAVATGATAAPTIVAALIDPAESSAQPDTSVTSVFILADQDSAGAYHPTFTHTVQGALSAGEFRRYVDHLDITGSGTDEIFLEGWTFAGDTFLAVLAWRDGAWTEIYRTPESWCLDERKKK